MNQKIILLSLIGLFVLPFILAFFISSPNEKAVFQSRAASSGKTITVSGLTGEAIQKAIDSANDGDTIVFPPGNYQGPTAIPMGLGDGIAVSADRGGAATCFVRIEKKTLTLKGQGAVLYGEGHSQPYKDPYQTRGGLCILNGANVTVDGLRLKEFQKRCAVVYNSTVVVKNSIIDGCDEGGYSLLGNSAGLFVNNNFSEMNFGGVMLWQNSQAKIVNNIFYDAAVLYFYHPGTNDKARADIINNIFSPIKSDVAQVSWWKADPSQIQSNKLSYNIIWRSADQTCDPSAQFWCDNFPGKITADPMFTAPVTDPTGIAAWADFTLQGGSPALNVGDPSIPGPKTLGNAGGPCVQPDSSTCSSFIASNIPKQYEEPTPTSAVPDNSFPDQRNPEPIIPTIEATIGPQPTSIQNNEFSNTRNTQYFLAIENKNSNKTLTIKGLTISDEPNKTDSQIQPGKTTQVEIQKCSGGGNLDGGILYSFLDDPANTLHFKNFSIDCSRQQTISIE